MLSRRSSLLIAGAFLLVAIEAGSWWVSSASTPQRAEQSSETTKYYDCPSNGSIVWCETINARRWISAGDHLTAVSTAIIAFFTGTLWIVTGKSVRLARAEFAATHRPRISVRGFRAIPEGTHGETIFITFSYVNVGDLPATITEIQTNLTIAETLPSGLAFASHKIEGITLESGDKETFAIRDDSMGLHFFRTTNQIRPHGTVPSTIYVSGAILYEDGRGRRRETGFCRLSQNGTDRWIIVEDSEYEYQD